MGVLDETIDSRAPRFIAATTFALFLFIFASILLGGKALGLFLLLVQIVIYTIGALVGVEYTPQGMLFNKLKPHLVKNFDKKPKNAVDFSHFVGMVVSVIVFSLFLLGINLIASLLFLVLIGLTGLNAFKGHCVACQIYPVVSKIID